jgi:hypothetical protein
LSELSLIRQHLSERGLSYIVPRIVNPNSPVLVLELTRDRLAETASMGKTSRRQLAFVCKLLENQHGKRVIVTLRDSQALDDIAAALRAVLRHGFPEIISDVHVSFETSTAAVVWVETKATIGQDISGRIEASAKKILSDFGVACKAFDVVLPQLPQASTAAILRAVKVHAPVSLAGVNEDLLKRGFSSPSDKWLSHKLDMARKRGLVLRDEDGRFLLTAAGLAVVPWSRSASSSDVDRMLSLARRTEWQI